MDSRVPLVLPHIQQTCTTENAFESKQRRHADVIGIKFCSIDSFDLHGLVTPFFCVASLFASRPRRKDQKGSHNKPTHNKRNIFATTHRQAFTLYWELVFYCTWWKVSARCFSTTHDVMTAQVQWHLDCYWKDYFGRWMGSDRTIAYISAFLVVCSHFLLTIHFINTFWT
jgi:hypothetical protein